MVVWLYSEVISVCVSDLFVDCCLLQGVCLLTFIFGFAVCVVVVVVVVFVAVFMIIPFSCQYCCCSGFSL